jgi:hypothetical protein
MLMRRVISSNLVSVGYAQNSQTLRIQFHNATYDYFNVPSQVYHNLLNASSKGGYHTAYIKNSYRYRKI